MKTIFIYCWSFFSLFLSIGSIAQQSNNSTDYVDYFQQKCDYNIQVTLDDEAHSLDAFLEIDYTNNSPDALEYIYFHLWPNAFTSQNTAFAQQMLENKSSKFFYSKPSQKGNISGLDFKVDGQSANLEIDSKNPDYGKLLLPKKLPAGSTIKISTPFKVKIPDSFSRLGHVGESYQITQWYPKPAVYDHKGWHPMPYLNQGEFYSEYGSFDVKITLPKNYVVGATGDLQNEEEIAFLNDLAKKTAKIKEFEESIEFPPSDPEFKTLHYKQDNIHDFAWFADKRFHVLKEEFTLFGSKEIKTAWAMFTNKEADLWTKGAEYVRDAVIFYSEKVGNYPYQQATAVQSALSAGAGMEYPNVTVIGVSRVASALERVIVHEVGHNWFYGQLGSNERIHPWLDEGTNSYYEERYFREKDSKSGAGEEFGIPDGLLKVVGLEDKTVSDIYEKLYQMGARNRNDQPIETTSEDFTSSNYGSIAYVKTSLAFKYLEAYLGKKELDRIMQEYYRRFEFKHPYPEDLKAVFEEECKKPIDWFFDELIPTDKRINYWLYKIKKEGQTIGNDDFDVVTVRNHPYHNVNGPYSVTAVLNDEPLKTVWYDGFWGQEEVLFPSMDYDYLVLDYKHDMPEYDRTNNLLKPKGLFKNSTGFNLSLIPKLEADHKKQLFVFPLASYNTYNGFMAGMTFYNSFLPARKFNYAIAPMFAFGSQTLSGMAELNYNINPANGFLKKIELNLRGKTFAYDIGKIRDAENNVLEEIPIHFYKVAPKVTFELREKSARSNQRKAVSLRHIQLWSTEVADNVSKTANYFDNYYVNEIAFDYTNTALKRKFGVPKSFNITAQQSNDFVLGTIEAIWKISIGEQRQKLDLRLFGGNYFVNDSNSGYLKRMGMSGNGVYDATFDHQYLGRFKIDGGMDQQLYRQHGHSKLVSSIGRTQEWLFAANIETDIPFIPLKLPIRLYADFGISPYEEFGEEAQFLWNCGAALSFFDGNVAVYVPLLYPDIYDTSVGDKFYKNISFLINFDAFNPIRAGRDLKF